MTNENMHIHKMEEEEGGFDIKGILMKLLIYWKWIVFSVICCMVGAAFYLKTTTPVYRIQATVMINDELKGSYQNQMRILQQDFDIMNTSGGIDNEIEVLRSKSIIKQAILDLDMYMVYRVESRLKSQVIYGSYPVNAYIAREDLDELSSTFTFVVSQPDSAGYLVEYKTTDPETLESVEFSRVINALPYTLQTPVGNVYLTKGEAKGLADNQRLSVSIVPPIKMAKSCLGSLSVEPTSKTTSIAYISYLDVNKKRGVDFVNSLVAAYNSENNNDKNAVALKTEEFLKERLQLVEQELDETEYEMAEYKQTIGLTNVAGDAQKALEGSTEYEKRRVEVTTQLSLVDYLEDYVNNPANALQVIPVNMGLTDASLTSFISKYNEGVVERNRLLRTASESNPAVEDITLSLTLMSNAIKASVASLHKSLTIKKRDIDAQAAKFDAKKGVVPTQEKILAGYMRKQEVKSGLYLMLLQKREENTIALTATSDNAKIIDAALPNDTPVSPNRKMIWLVALVIGCAVPVAVIYIKELLRYKIEGRNDLVQLTNTPLLGDVPLANGDKKGLNIVVRENDNDVMAETFRTLRANLQFLLDSSEKKVIQFTSTTSGEGKTFVSSNLAMSLALLGKKVVFVGLDIRKPRLVELFGLSDRKRGITNFLAGDAANKTFLFEQIMPSGINKNLDILPAGIVPPNPTELLSKVNLDNAIAFLKEKYDYVILDTAPVGLVADTLIIARVADASVYICRADYTAKSDLELVNTLYAEKKLTNLSIVLNGVDMTKRKYGYYYGYGSYGRYGKYRHGQYGQYGYSPEISIKS